MTTRIKNLTTAFLPVPNPFNCVLHPRDQPKAERIFQLSAAQEEQANKSSKLQALLKQGKILKEPVEVFSREEVAELRGEPAPAVEVVATPMSKEETLELFSAPLVTATDPVLTPETHDFHAEALLPATAELDDMIASAVASASTPVVELPVEDSTVVVADDGVSIVANVPDIGNDSDHPAVDADSDRQVAVLSLGPDGLSVEFPGDDATEEAPTSDAEVDASAVTDEPAKKKRGRPKKNPEA
jgi:hypothetical protein